jgi:ATP-binding cassette, subfamily B, multidrug efflux pump
MLKLIKYLKPYLSMILFAIVLLFIQANADLALPDYLSRIVNTGIQQGGVESAVPTAIRKSEMDRLVLFMSDAEKGQVLDHYTLVEQSSVDYDQTVEQYPILAKEALYVLKSSTKEEISTLNPILGKSWLVVSGIEAALTDPAKAKELAGSMGAGMNFDLSKLPPGTDIFSVLAKFPAEQRAKITDAINQKFAALGDKMIVQAAVVPVKAEYETLGVDAGQMQNDYILKTGLSMLLLTLLSAACTIVVSFLSARTAAGVARDLRKSVFKKVESFSNTEFDKFSTASLITRSTNDITQIQMVVIMMVRMVFYAPIMGVGGVIRAMGKDSSMWWIIAVAVLVLLSLIITVFSVALPKFKLIQKLIDRLNLVSRENLSGMMVIRAFNMQPFEEDRFDKANKDLTSVMLFVNRVMVVMFPVMMLIMNGLSLIIIWIGSHQVAEARMQVGDMMAFLQYTMQIVFSFLMLSMMFIILPRASVSGDRIAEVLNTDPTIKDPEQPKQFSDRFKGVVEFRNVSFRYPGGLEDALTDITFTARPGQTTALIGATGSGKSTIVNLIPRFYEVTDGSITIDGVDIRQVTQHDLREKIGYVPQKSNLFSGTIASNLLYADENALPEELKTAADIAQATEFIDAKPEGIQAQISQGGTNVSGGQKQRLSIARALVKKAPIYIFDDSFSALDFRTDASLRRAMKEKTGDSTLLIVTQRVSTIKNADQIIVLDDGKMVGKGTHRELMDSCEPYREIALSQLSKEELA